jgi:GNAT superfamily N-acetyltransferase
MVAVKGSTPVHDKSLAMAVCLGELHQTGNRDGSSAANLVLPALATITSACCVTVKPLASSARIAGTTVSAAVTRSTPSVRANRGGTRIPAAGQPPAEHSTSGSCRVAGSRPRVAWLLDRAGRKALQAGGMIDRWMTVLTSWTAGTGAGGPGGDSGLRAGAYPGGSCAGPGPLPGFAHPACAGISRARRLDGTGCAGFLRYLVQVIGAEEGRPAVLRNGEPLMEGYVEAFGVDPQRRRRGVGTALQQHAVRQCRTAGCYQMRSRSPVTSTENYALKIAADTSCTPATRTILTTSSCAFDRLRQIPGSASTGHFRCCPGPSASAADRASPPGCQPSGEPACRNAARNCVKRSCGNVRSCGVVARRRGRRLLPPSPEPGEAVEHE